MLNVTETFLPPFEEYAAFLQRTWASKWVTNRGDLVQELERQVSEYLGIGAILAVSNGTIALQLAIRALGLTGEVVTTPFSYVATVSSIVWEHCKPVFVDIEPDHLTIDPRKIEAAMTEQTSAILATHVYGNPCDVDSIGEIAERHGVRTIYDAAHCFGVKYRGRSILEWGDASSLSFHATKLFHTGEGGAIVCNDADLAHRIFFHHNFGHNGPEDFWGLGVNGKLSELNAAMGLAVLSHVPDLIAARAQACRIYDVLLEQVPVRTLVLRDGTDWNYSYYPVVFASETDLLSVKSAMNKDGIFPRRYFYPSLNTVPYVESEAMPIAEDLSRRVLCLPLSAAISEADVRRVCRHISQNV
ncbi:MAG: DegT/DnrJ/EryC1/StrS family aminotransferase [Acidobacteria bacterium]|nr:DegT/DnrJ/EryC1/StrS family aminotransferase [Acidobacteriota bacterium]